MRLMDRRKPREPNLTPEQKRNIVIMRTAGVDVTKIAEAYGVATSTIYAALAISRGSQTKTPPATTEGV